MKFSNVKIEPEAMRPEDAASFTGLSTDWIERLRKAGWVKPIIQRHRLTLYRRSALILMLNRIEAEGLPETPGPDPSSPATT